MNENIFLDISERGDQLVKQQIAKTSKGKEECPFY